MTRRNQTKSKPPETDPADDDKSYLVGYGRPPTRTQFKAGQSGNPKGRAKGSVNFNTILDDELKRLYPINVGGKNVKIPALSALIRRLVHDALKGDKRAAAILLQLRSQQGVASSTPDTTAALSSQDQAIVEAMMKEIEAEAAEALAKKRKTKSPKKSDAGK